MYKSGKAYYLIDKYLFLIFALVWIGGWLSFFITPGATIKINGDVERANFQNTIVFLVFGLIFLIPYFLVGRRMALVEMDNEKIIIKFNHKIKQYSWSQIEDIYSSTYAFIIPSPITWKYRIRIKGDAHSYLFSISKYSTFFSDKDSLKIKKLIDEKMGDKEL